MKNITKKIFTSAISAVISLTAVAAFTAPAAPVLAASNNRGQTYGYSYSYELEQYELKKQEGIRFLENCITDPSSAGQHYINRYSAEIRKHQYDIRKSYEQNLNELVRYVNNVYKNIIYWDQIHKFEDYKDSKIIYLISLSDGPDDDAIIDSVFHTISGININFPGSCGSTYEEQVALVDQLTEEAEREIISNNNTNN